MNEQYPTLDCSSWRKYDAEDNYGSSIVIAQPPADLIEATIANALAGKSLFPFTKYEAGTNAWGWDNHEYIFGTWLIKCGPELARKNLPFLRLIVEAYLSRVIKHDEPPQSFEETACDGETASPDHQVNNVKLKSPFGCGHDLGFVQHHSGVADAYGKRWTRAELDAGFRDAHIASGLGAIGWIKYGVLRIASWWFWIVLVAAVPLQHGCVSMDQYGEGSRIECNLIKLQINAEANAQIAGSSMHPNVSVDNKLEGNAVQSHKLPFETEVSAPTKIDATYHPPTQIFGSK